MLTMSRSPWCKSYEDEIFYITTLKQLGEKYKKYPRLLGLSTMMCVALQPDNSPFAKNKNLQRFMKELATLMNR